MASVTFEQNRRAVGSVLTGRVLIGRRLSPGITAEDPSVGRLHAWIDRSAEGWAVTDAGGPTGTQVNGKSVKRHKLVDGDVIAAGVIEVRFSTGDVLPAEVAAVQLSPRDGVVNTAGILFDCACGSPIWVGKDLAGKRGMCRHCRRPVTVPRVPLAESQPKPTVVESIAKKPIQNPIQAGSDGTPEDPARTASRPGLPAYRQTRLGSDFKIDTKPRSPKCGVCHGNITAGESSTRCPECDAAYHAECWDENGGCSTYGCHGGREVPAVEPVAAAVAVDEPTTPFPWGTALVAAAVVGTGLGAITFGLPAAVVLVVAVVMMRSSARRGLFVVAIVIAVVGFIVGLGVSDWWYLHGRHLPKWGR